MFCSIMIMLVNVHSYPLGIPNWLCYKLYHLRYAVCSFSGLVPENQGYEIYVAGVM